MAIGRQTRRSIAFQVWLRLSAIIVSFTLIALTVYVWLEIGDNIRAAEDQATVRADAIAAAIAQMNTTAHQPTDAEMAIASTLGVRSIQKIAADGSVTSSFGELTGESAFTPAQPANGLPSPERGYDVQLKNGGFVRNDITAFDLLRGGEYGSVHTYALAPEGATAGFASLRVVVAYQDISHSAQTLLFRSLALTGGIMGVAIVAMWLLLYRFVARPLRGYSALARRIAAGEPLHMPDTGRNELGELGQAINGMAEILRYQASVDSLTGLYNSRHLTSRLEGLLEEARAKTEPLAVITCDLDNLKPVNDAYGHQVGDLLLKAVARQLLAWANVEYTCWRTGGDEFAAVIQGVAPDRAHQEAIEPRAADQLDGAERARRQGGGQRIDRCRHLSGRRAYRRHPLGCRGSAHVRLEGEKEEAVRARTGRVATPGGDSTRWSASRPSSRPTFARQPVVSRRRSDAA